MENLDPQNITIDDIAHVSSEEIALDPDEVILNGILEDYAFSTRGTFQELVDKILACHDRKFKKGSKATGSGEYETPPKSSLVAGLEAFVKNPDSTGYKIVLMLPGFTKCYPILDDDNLAWFLDTSVPSNAYTCILTSEGNVYSRGRSDSHESTAFRETTLRDQGFYRDDLSYQDLSDQLLKDAESEAPVRLHAELQRFIQLPPDPNRYLLIVMSDDESRSHIFYSFNNLDNYLNEEDINSEQAWIISDSRVYKTNIDITRRFFKDLDAVHGSNNP